ncbi:MAG: GntR family transcriptional regulator [Brachybacterium sp.]|nr:GntR family transcriptional regulator [Brachybacterium sp.]
MPSSPKYRALVEELRTLIGDAETGDAVPSERQLAEQSGVSRMTARKAIDELVREGLLAREVGRGTYVTRPAISLPLHLTGFSEDMRTRGLVPSSLVLDIHTEPAGTRNAEAFGIDPTEPVIRLDRVRLADGHPFAIERTSLRAEAVPGLAAYDFTHASLYEVLTRDYDIHIDSGHQVIRAGIVGREDAELLEMEEGGAVLELVRTSAVRERVVERTVSTYPGDRYELSAALAPVRAPGSAARSALQARH